MSPLGRWSGISMHVPSIQRTKLRLLSPTFLMKVCSSFVASLMGGTMMTSPFCREVLSCSRKHNLISYACRSGGQLCGCLVVHVAEGNEET